MQVEADLKIQSSWSHHLFLPRHLVISLCLLAVHCGKPSLDWSHVINEKTARYHYSAAPVRMNCDYGYKRAKGSYALRCLSNGRWNDTSLRCKRRWSSGVRYHLVRFCVRFMASNAMSRIENQGGTCLVHILLSHTFLPWSFCTESIKLLFLLFFFSKTNGVWKPLQVILHCSLVKSLTLTFISPSSVLSSSPRDF